MVLSSSESRSSAFDVVTPTEVHTRSMTFRGRSRFCGQNLTAYHSYALNCLFAAAMANATLPFGVSCASRADSAS